MGRNKKRKFPQLAEDLDSNREALANSGVAATLAHVRALETPSQITTSSGLWHTHDESEKEHDEGDWITVGRGGKRHKKNTYPTLSFGSLHRLQSSLKISDLQNLVLYCLADAVGPQWVAVKNHSSVKKAVVLLVPGLEKGMFDGSIALEEPSNNKDSKQPMAGCQEVNGTNKEISASDVGSIVGNNQAAGHKSTSSPDDYMPVLMVPASLPAPMKPLADMFTHRWPVKAPGDDKFSKVYSPLHAMLTAPITKSQEEKRQEKQVKGARPSKASQHWENQRTQITAFIASKEELIENDYIVHPALFIEQDEKEQENTRRQAAKETVEMGWVDTLTESLEDGDVVDTELEQGNLTAGRTILAMDCEMCKVDDGEMALTRISIVGWDGEVIMDELVKPDRAILDYLTPYSGITPKKLASVTTTLKEIQTRLLNMLTPQTIILGHSLNADLSALKLTHPFILDTTLLYQHPRGPPLKSSLKWLAQKYLNREIQKGHGSIGHDSIEDARACLDLVKLKCERGPKWGTIDAAGESIFKRLQRSVKGGASSGKIGAIVDRGHPEKNFGSMATFCIGCGSDSEVVEGVRRAVLGDPDGHTIPGGGVDFTWARLRDLETLCGWSNDHRLPSASSALPSSPTPVSPALNSTPEQARSPASLSATLSKTISHVAAIRAFLPPCTLLIVYSGTGDPREVGRLQDMQRTFKREYAVKKWDELSVRWTDTEEQALKKACRKAREGMGFVGIF